MEPTRVVALFAAVAALALVGCTPSDESEKSGSTPSSEPSQSGLTAKPPASLDDLASGEPAAVPYVIGRTLTIAGQQVALERRPANVIDSAFAVILRYGDGSVDRMIKSSLRIDRLAGRAGSPPVTDPGGNVVAWVTPNTSVAEVAIHSLRGPSIELDRQRFPAEPECCDDPFQVVGMSQLADLYVSMPARDLSWAWNFYEGQEGIPNEVPDSDKYVTQIRGLHGGQLVQITANEVVVHYPPRAKNTASYYGVGIVRRGTYRETERVQATQADFNTPSARHILYWTQDGTAHLTSRTSGAGVRRGQQEPTTVQLGLPAETEAEVLMWESGKSVLLIVDNSASESPPQAIVRCQTRTGVCEIAGEFPRRAVIARR